VKLVLSCLVPVIVGKAVRELITPVRTFVQNHKTFLSLLSTTNLAILIWQTISSAQGLIVGLPFGTMLLLIAAAALLHTLYLVLNTAAVMLLQLDAPEAACVVIMASQKVGRREGGVMRIQAIR
jgi:sodium/bile acid cotransporter 7